MSKNLRPISGKQYLITIDGLEAYFTKATAPKISKAQEKYNDGVSGVERTHLDFVTYENVTLTKPYDPAKDVTLEDWALEAIEDSRSFTVSIQPVNADQAGTPINGARTLILSDCQLASFEAPAVDREGSGMAMLGMELIVGSFTYQ